MAIMTNINCGVEAITTNINCHCTVDYHPNTHKTVPTIHERYEQPNHADIMLYRDAEGKLNYHLRLCCNSCNKYTRYVGVCRQQDIADTNQTYPFVGIGIPVKQCIFYNAFVHVYVIDIANAYALDGSEHWQQIIVDCAFVDPYVDARYGFLNKAPEFFPRLEGTVGDLILFAKWELFRQLSEE